MQLRASDFEKLAEVCGEINSEIECEFKEKQRFIEFSISAGKKALIKGRAFKGSKFIKPWIELSYELYNNFGYEELSEIFTLLFKILPEGGYIMVKYSSHKEVAKALAIGVPEAATELGYALIKAGFTWFKDWYFPEGGMEGEEKLQANKAISREHEIKRKKELIDELERFIKEAKKDKELEIYVKNAERAIEVLKEKENHA